VNLLVSLFMLLVLHECLDSHNLRSMSVNLLVPVPLKTCSYGYKIM
jgi:hypothetical protein